MNIEKKWRENDTTIYSEKPQVVLDNANETNSDRLNKKELE